MHIHFRSPGRRVRIDGEPTQRISLRAEVLRAALRFFKTRQGRRVQAAATVRRRLKRIEPFVPRPPAGTRTTVIDGSGVNTVHVAVPQARSDRCVLYFHGGAYALGTATLLRDFTWRIGAAARACVLYFDYRLAPEHPFPAALEDAVAVYRWLAARSIPPESPSSAIRQAAVWRWRRSTSCATRVSPCRRPRSRSHRGPIWR